MTNLRFAIELFLLASSFALAVGISLFRFVEKIKKKMNAIFLGTLYGYLSIFLSVFHCMIFLLLYFLILPAVRGLSAGKH